MPEPFRNQMKGPRIHSDQRIGQYVYSAIWVGYSSASDLGASSPATMVPTVNTSRITMAAADAAPTVSRPARSCNRPASVGRERNLAVRTEDQAAERDADLTGGDIAVQRFGVFQDRQQPLRRLVAVFGELPDAAASDGHGGELSGDVEGGHRDQEGHDEEGGQHVSGPCQTPRGLQAARSHGPRTSTGGKPQHVHRRTHPRRRRSPTSTGTSALAPNHAASATRAAAAASVSGPGGHRAASRSSSTRCCSRVSDVSADTPSIAVRDQSMRHVVGAVACVTPTLIRAGLRSVARASSARAALEAAAGAAPTSRSGDTAPVATARPSRTAPCAASAQTTIAPGERLCRTFRWFSGSGWMGSARIATQAPLASSRVGAAGDAGAVAVDGARLEDVQRLAGGKCLLRVDQADFVEPAA